MSKNQMLNSPLPPWEKNPINNHSSSLSFLFKKSSFTFFFATFIWQFNY